MKPEPSTLDEIIYINLTKIGIFAQNTGIEKEDFIKSMMGQLFSFCIQMIDTPEELAERFNSMIIDGIDAQDEKTKDKLKKFQRLTFFCENE